MPEASPRTPPAILHEWRIELRNDPAPSEAFLSWIARSIGASIERSDGTDWSAAELAEAIGRWQPTRAYSASLTADGPRGATFSVTFSGENQQPISDNGAWAWGGLADLTGDADGPPLAPGAPLASMCSALHAAVALLAASYCGHRSTAITIDLSDVVASLTEVSGIMFAMRGELRGRTGDLGGSAGWGLYQCAEGSVAIALRDLSQLYALGEALGIPEVRNERYADFQWGYGEHVEELGALLMAACLDRTAAEVETLLGERRIAVSRATSLDDLLTDEHLLHRAALQEEGGLILPSFPLNISGAQVTQARDIASRELPLTGVRVLDAASVWAGPFAGRILSDLGATGIKLVRPEARAGTFSTGQEWDRDLYAILNDRNKDGFLADLSTPAGCEWFEGEIKCADVFVENFAHGSLARMGYAHERLHQLNPNLIIVAMPAMGLSGPNASRIGYGATIEQAAGIGNLYTDAEGHPHKSGINFSDPIAGLWGAIGALVALHTSRSNCVVELSQQEASLSLMLGVLAAHQRGAPAPRAVEGQPQGSGWAMPQSVEGSVEFVTVREMDAIAGTPDQPGTSSFEWARHGNDVEYPLIRLPWTGDFARDVPLEPVLMPTIVGLRQEEVEGVTQ